MEISLTDTPARTRNAADTRGRILEAARRRFARESYDEVGLRDVAGDAGVDAALISRYFGSKEDLFAEVLDTCGDARDWFTGDRVSFGRDLAHELVMAPQEMDDNKLEGLLIALRSIGSGRAADLVRQSSEERFYKPFIQWLGGPDAEVRSRLVLGVMMGMALSRELSGGFGLNDADKTALYERLTAIFQHCLD